MTQSRATARDLEHFRKRRHRDGRGHRGRSVRERPRVARGEQGGQDRRIHQAVAFLVGAQALTEERLEEWGHLRPAPGLGVEARELAVGRKACQTVVHPVDPGLAMGERLLADADPIELAVAAKRAEEPALDRQLAPLLTTVARVSKVACSRLLTGR